MSKISKIEISDFRIYRDKQVFSFEDDGRVADLVLIYAPNGYGKTSFFDAVEWAYSGKIERFERGMIKEEIFRRDFAEGHQILLTNRKSYKEKKLGLVNIVLEDGSALQRQVESRKIQNQDCYVDYRAGIFDSYLDADGEGLLKRLAQTNLLTQDQIDAFLKYTTPEEKFVALSKFWDEGGYAVEVIKNVSGYIRVLRNGRANLTKRKNDLESRIAELLNTDTNINNLNQSISELSRLSVLEFAANPIVSPVTDEVYNSLKDLIGSFLKRAERVLLNSDELKAKLDDLQLKIDDFSSNENKLSSSRAELTSIERLEKLFVDQASIVKDRNFRRESILRTNRDVEELKKLESFWDEYQRSRLKIEYNMKSSRNLLTEIDWEIHKSSVFGTRLRKFEHHLNDWVVQVSALQVVADSYVDNYNQYVYWKNLLDGLIKQDRPLAEKLDNSQKVIDSHTSNRQHWQLVLETQDIHRLRDSEVVELQDFLDEMNSAMEYRRDLEADLAASQEMFRKTGSLNEDLEKLILWGENYISVVETPDCPLCKTKFGKVEILLENVRKGKGNVLSIEKQQEAIDKLMVRISNETGRYNRTLETVMSRIREWLASCEQKLNASFEERSVIDGDLMQLRNQINNAEEKLGSYHERIASTASLNDENSDKSPEIVREELLEQVELLKIKVVRLENIIKIQRTLLEGCDNRVASSKNRRASLENDTLLISSEKKYVESDLLFDKLEIRSDGAKEKITAIISEFETFISSEQIIVEGLSKSINSMQESIANDPLQFGEASIPGRKTEIQNEITRLESLINTFRQSYHTAIPGEDIGRDQISNAQNEILKRIQGVSIEIGKLDKILMQIELITENIEKAKCKEELVEIDKKFSEYDIAEGKLNEAREGAVEYIDQEISNYFNKETINQIYSRIEPHPDLNTVEFLPDFTGKSFIVDVRAKGDEDNVNPLLYLSAGQLNVLSLSIFLASIIESESELINTIFMDDPVQNLSDINILSFIDIIRSIVLTSSKQIVISTHDEQFFKLMQNKMPADIFNAKYIKLTSFGQVN